MCLRVVFLREVLMFLHLALMFGGEALMGFVLTGSVLMGSVLMFLRAVLRYYDEP
jgi:hypothetical protein